MTDEELKWITGAATEVALLDIGFEFLAEPYRLRAVVWREHVAQILHNDIPKRVID